MNKLQFSWTPTLGLFVLPHPELFKAIDTAPLGFFIADPSDVDAFNVTAINYNWPRMRVTGWRDEVERALIDIEPRGAMSCHAKIALTFAVMDFLDGSATLEQAFETIEAGREHE